MQRVIKQVNTDKGKLYCVKGTSRYLLSDCSASIEIIEESKNIPVLGRGNIIHRRCLSMLVTFNHQVNQIPLERIDSIGFKGDFIRNDGRIVSIQINQCLLVSDLDLTSAGTCTFEAICTEDTMRLLNEL